MHSVANDTKPVTQDEDRAPLSTGPLEDLNTLQREVRGLIHDQLQLAALEVRLASRSLMTMISAALCMGVLLVLVWVGLMTAVGLFLMDSGLRPSLAVLAVTALTSVLVVVLFGLIRQRSRDLGLPATMRALSPSVPEYQDRSQSSRES